MTSSTSSIPDPYKGIVESLHRYHLRVQAQAEANAAHVYEFSPAPKPKGPAVHVQKKLKNHSRATA